MPRAWQTYARLCHPRVRSLALQPSSRAPLTGQGAIMSKAEQIASASLRRLLAPLSAGDSIPDSEDFRKLQGALEYLLPAALAESYPWWRYESIDRFHFSVARKQGREEGEFVGLCLLISDQSWTPLHLYLRAAAVGDALDRLDLRIGEEGPGNGGMTRTPFASNRRNKLLHSLERRLGEISWAYAITRDQA